MKRIFVVAIAAAALLVGAAYSGHLRAHAENTVDAQLSQAIAKLSDEQKAALLVLVKGIVEAKPAGESPAEAAMKTIAAFIKAAEAGDVDAMMAQVSEKFNHYEVGGKADYRAYMDGVKTEGMLEDIKGSMEDAKAEVKGDTVKVYPVELEGIFGTVTFEFDLKNDGDKWRIVGLDMTGV